MADGGDDKPSWWQRGMRYRQNGTIEWRFYVKTASGSKQRSAYGRTINELKRDRQRIEKQSEFSADRIRLNELLDRYLEYKQREKAADPRNLAMLKQKFTDYLRTQLGTYDLARLCERWSIIGDHFDGLSARHPNSRTIQITFDELRRAFKYALKNQWCSVNPCAYLDRPQYQASDPVIFSTEQIYELLERATGQDRMIILTFLFTTLRPSEVWGIKMKHLNLDLAVLPIVTFVNTDEHGVKVEKDKGKTRRATREMPLLPELVQAFRAYLAGKNLRPDDYVFANAGGGLINDNNWRRHHFKPLAKALGLEDATPYDLRHSANTFLAEVGVPDDIRAAICGHSKEVNRRVYTHIRIEAKRQALSNLTALLRFGDKGTDEGKKDGTTAA